MENFISFGCWNNFENKSYPIVLDKIKRFSVENQVNFLCITGDNY